MVKRKNPILDKRKGRGRRATDNNLSSHFTNATMGGCLFLIGGLTLTVILLLLCKQGDGKFCRAAEALVALLLE